jgi:hypothetical protein
MEESPSSGTQAKMEHQVIIPGGKNSGHTIRVKFRSNIEIISALRKQGSAQNCQKERKKERRAQSSVLQDIE